MEIRQMAIDENRLLTQPAAAQERNRTFRPHSRTRSRPPYSGRVCVSVWVQPVSRLQVNSRIWGTLKKSKTSHVRLLSGSRLQAPDCSLVGEGEKILLFRHQPASEPLLLRLREDSQLQDGDLIEVVVAGVPDYPIIPILPDCSISDTDINRFQCIRSWN